MKHEKVYEVTIINQLLCIGPSLIVFLFPVWSIALSLYKGEEITPDTLLFTLIIWIVLGILYVVPLILHFTYYKNDKNKKLIIYGSSDFTIIENSEQFAFKKEDIASITNYYGSFGRYHFRRYEFFVFRMKNKQEFVLTCLIFNKDTVGKNFPDAKFLDEPKFIQTLNTRL